MIESILFLALSLGWAAIDQAKHDREVKRRKEERRKNSSGYRFFWE